MNDNNIYKYTIKQVMGLVGESESRLNYWMTYYSQLLNLDGKNVSPKRYSDDDIKKLKTIKMMVNEKGYCAKEIRKYFESEYNNDGNENFNNDEFLKFTREFLCSLDIEFRILFNEQFLFLKSLYKKNNEELKDELTKTITSTINSSLEGINDYHNKQIDMLLKIIARKDEHIDNLNKIISDYINKEGL